jgi:hypothetical protein
MRPLGKSMSDAGKAGRDTKKKGRKDKEERFTKLTEDEKQ